MYLVFKFIGEIRGFKGDELSARVDAVVRQVALQGVLHQRIETLSKGFKRRVGLAQAIIHDPQVLILMSRRMVWTRIKSTRCVN